MSIRSIIVSLGMIIGLNSCIGDTGGTDPVGGTITIPSTPVTVPADINGEVEIDLQNQISVSGNVDPSYLWYIRGDSITTQEMTTDQAMMEYDFPANGDYVVTLIITDNNNNAPVQTVTIDVTINNASDDPAPNPDNSLDGLIQQAIDGFISGDSGFAAPCSNCHYIGGTDTGLNFKVSATANLTVTSVKNGMTTWIENGGFANYENPIDSARTNHAIKFALSADTQSANTQIWTDLANAMNQYVDDLANQENRNPVAIISSSSTSENTYSFDASGSTDPEGTALTYSWNFGDGSALSTAANPTHTFAANDKYTVVLTVSDGENSATATKLISTKPVLVGDLDSGEALYAQLCESCHKTEGAGIPGVYEPIAINNYLDGVLDLEEKINNTMPPAPTFSPSDCEDQCAADINAYMMQWERQIVSYSCPAEKIDATKYGPRQMRLLTISEYANTVYDLFGFVVDESKLSANAQVHEFDNQVKTNVDFNRFKSFEAMASVIADAAATQNFTNVKGAGACIAGGDCSSAFINDVAKNGYRRPLDAAEQAAYGLLFDNSNSGTEAEPLEGMRLAVRTMLMSPYFLYRSELGMTKEQFIDFNENAPPIFVPVGNSTEISVSSLGLTNGELPLYQSTTFTHNFTGGEQIQFTATGENSPGHNDVVESDAWPTLRVSVQNGATLFEGQVSPTGSSFLFPADLTGNQTISINNVTSNHPKSDSRIMTIEAITISEFDQIQFEIPEMDDDAYALTPYEMATFIAYTYTGTTPDSALLSAADSGLFSDADVQAQIERLLATDKAKEHFGEFAAQWLTTDAVLVSEKDADLYPLYTQEVRQAMAQEVREIFNDVLFNDSVPFSSLYDSDYTFVNSTLASFYGLGGVSGDDFVKTTAPGRGGLVTSGAFLSAWTSPTESKLILRGVRLRERFLCQHLPPFPSNVNLGDVREAQAAEVDRVKAENDGLIRQAHLDYINTDVDACKSCHEYIINPLGVGLEDFDAVGLPRTHYANGLTVDFTGFQSEKENHNSVFYGIDDLFDSSQSRAFQGAENLGEVLATEEVTKACMIEMSFRFMMGTGPDEFDHANTASIAMDVSEREDYACTTDAMTQKMTQDSDNPKAAIIEFGISDIVRFRKQYNR